MSRQNKLTLGLVIFLSSFLNAAVGKEFNPQNNVPKTTMTFDEEITDRDFVSHLKVFCNAELETPEDLAVDEQSGLIYTGLRNGNIVTYDGGELKVIARGQGMVLGVKLSPDRRYLYFVDSKAGMCRLDLTNSTIELLTSGYNGAPFSYLNNFDVAEDGKIYMADSTTKYSSSQLFQDVLEGRPHGKIYVYDPTAKTTKVLLENLYFPNGIQVSPDQQTIYIAETNICRLGRYHLKGDKTGRYEIVLDGLPGNPDNIKFNSEGHLWVPFPVFRTEFTEKLLSSLFVRKLLSWVPESLMKLFINPKQLGGILVDVNQGRVLKVLRSADVSKIKTVTTLLESGGQLLFGSLTQNCIGVLNLPDFNSQPASADTNDEL